MELFVNSAVKAGRMNYKDHIDRPIEHDEELPQSCPICETHIHRLVLTVEVGEQKIWFACECMGSEEFEGHIVSESGIHDSIRELWGEEVHEVMTLYPEKFPLGAIPKPIDLEGRN